MSGARKADGTSGTRRRCGRGTVHRCAALAALAYALTALPAASPVGAQSTPPWSPASRSGPGAARWLATHAFYRAAIVHADPQIVFFGDSLVERFPRTGAATWRTRELPRGAFASGIAGDTTQNALWRIDNGAFDDVGPRAIVVLVGTNDLPMSSPPEVARGIVAVVERLRVHLPSAKILLLGLLPRDDDAVAAASGAVGAVNAALASTAFDAKVRYRNITATLADADGRPARQLLPDGLHLSAGGYERLAAAIDGDIDDLTRP